MGTIRDKLPGTVGMPTVAVNRVHIRCCTSPSPCLTWRLCSCLDRSKLPPDGCWGRWRSLHYPGGKEATAGGAHGSCDCLWHALRLPIHVLCCPLDPFVYFCPLTALLARSSPSLSSSVILFPGAGLRGAMPCHHTRPRGIRESAVVRNSQMASVQYENVHGGRTLMWLDITVKIRKA